MSDRTYTRMDVASLMVDAWRHGFSADTEDEMLPELNRLLTARDENPYLDPAAKARIERFSRPASAVAPHAHPE